MFKSKQKTTVNSINAIKLNDEDSISSFIYTFWQNRSKYKNNLERQWFQNIAWFAGKQNYIWDQSKQLLVEPTVPPWRVRMVVNLMRSHLRTLFSKLYKSQPNWDVIPATSDIADIQIAQMDKQILQYYWEQQDLTEKWLDALMWVILTGNGFIKCLWDADVGPEITVPVDDLDEELRQLLDNVQRVKVGNEYIIRLGDLCIEPISPFELLPDPLAKSINDSKYVMHSTIQYVDSVKDEWGAKAKDIVNEEEGYEYQVYDKKLRNISNILPFYNGTPEENFDKCMVHELWIKPQPKGKYVRGRHIVCCQGKVLKNTPLNYEHKQIPIIQLSEVKMPTHFWAESTASDLIPIQSEFNKSRSQIIENRNMMGRPKWFNPKGSGISEAALTSEPGEVIDYNVGFKPEMENPPPLPAYIQNLVSESRIDFEDVSGQHEVSRADAPGEVRSGRGILALIEQDDAKTNPVVTLLNKQLARLGVLVLSTLTQYAREERIATIVGEDDELITFTFKGDQLLGPNYGRPGVDYFKVRIHTLEGLPNSRVAQTALIETLAQTGFLNPEEDKETVFKLLNIGKVSRLLDKSRVHRSAALKENQRLLEGEQVPVFTWQNHEAHLEVLNEFRNSLAYESLNEEIKQLFTLHEQQHKEAMALVTVEGEILQRKAIQQLAQAHGIINNAEEPQGQAQANTQG